MIIIFNGVVHVFLSSVEKKLRFLTLRNYGIFLHIMDFSGVQKTVSVQNANCS